MQISIGKAHINALNKSELVVANRCLPIRLKFDNVNFEVLRACTRAAHAHL